MTFNKSSYLNRAEICDKLYLKKDFWETSGLTAGKIKKGVPMKKRILSFIVMLSMILCAIPAAGNENYAKGTAKVTVKILVK